MNLIGRNPSGAASELADAPKLRAVAAVSRSSQRKAQVLALIDQRTLNRECFVQTIEALNPKLRIKGFSSIDAWSEAAANTATDAILYDIGSRSLGDEHVASELMRVVARGNPTPVIVLGESEDLREIIYAVDCGARGYIPASIGIDAIMQATHVASTGGIFLPANSVTSLRDALAPKPHHSNGIEEHFTSRQAAVADSLRRGKANKIIAYELGMCESTVKVHIRNIMKKLNATNRTEAAFKLNALFPRDIVEGK